MSLPWFSWFFRLSHISTFLTVSSVINLSFPYDFSEVTYTADFNFFISYHESSNVQLTLVERANHAALPPPQLYLLNSFLLDTPISKVLSGLIQPGLYLQP